MIFKRSSSGSWSTVTFDTTDYYYNTIGRTITSEAPIGAADVASAEKFALVVKGIGRFVFANTSSGAIFSGGLTVNDSATIEVKKNSWPGKGDVTMNGTSTLLMYTGGEARTGNVTVNGGATLAVAESGTATLGGNLTLKEGAKLQFNVSKVDTMATLALASGKNVTLPANDKSVKVNVAADESLMERALNRATTDPYVLISGAGLQESDLSKFELANPPTWASRLAVVDGNLVLYSRAPGLVISIK